MVGLGQGLGEEGTHMAAAQAVDHAAPVAGGFHQAGEAELGKVLAGNSGAAPGD